MRTLISLCFTLLILSPISSLAQVSDPALEQRAREIGQSLRCVVCQNQSIDESDAPLAQDMRKLVRQRLSEGDTNEAVIAYMRDKYGDYVLLKPPVQSNTYILWLLPFGLLLMGLVWFMRSGSVAEEANPETSNNEHGST